MKIWLSRAMDPLERNESANITFVAEGEKVPDSCILLCVLKMLGFVLVVHCSRSNSLPASGLFSTCLAQI